MTESKGMPSMTSDLVPAVAGRMREADLGTHTLAYVDHGTGHPVIFMHGGLMDHQSWGHQLALADAFRLILPDTRGHGRSGGADLPATYSDFGADVIALMDRLGLEQASLIGFSDGGCSALAIGRTHPERITRLVLIGTPYHLSNYPPGTIERLRALTPEALLANCDPLLKEMIRKMRNHMSDAEWDAYWRRMIWGLWVSEPVFDLADFVTMPIATLILHGENERHFTRTDSEALAAAIPDATLLFVPDAGHSAAQENPEFVNRAIRRFLAE